MRLSDNFLSPWGLLAGSLQLGRFQEDVAMRQGLSPVAIMAAILITTSFGCCVPVLGQQKLEKPESRSFPNGFPTDPNFFPIAVWLQQPHTAANFAAMGINTFVGLWHPPTPDSLAQLQRHGIYLVLEQTQAALALKDSPVIRGWMHIDEPDNAQPDGKGGYGDCVSPDELVRRYKEMRARDPSRPVYLGFGQGVANPRWTGRGTKCTAIAPEVYYRAASRGADIVAFDIYPVAEARQAHVIGRLDLVGRGVRNLKRWVPAGVPVWADIETTRIKNPNRRPSPDELRNEVWMAIINGATGINYFVHEWVPSFREDGVFRYPDVVAELKRLNKQIQSLAPLLNGPTIGNVVAVDATGEIAHMVKESPAATYIFAVNLDRTPVRARIMTTLKAAGPVVTIGEDRSLTLANAGFDDSFEGYQAHIYQLQKK
jgi:hypothetical protein